MSKSKCTNYQIIITYINGDTEEVNYKDGINKNNFSEMRDFYTNKIKEQYKDDKNVATIEFIGITQNNEIKVLWTKEVSKIINEDILPMLGKDPRKLIKEATLIMSALKEQKDYLYDKRAICEKKRDTLLKELLLSDNEEDKSQKQKLELGVAKKIKRNEKERKRIKTYLYDAQTIIRDIDIDKIIETLKPFTIMRDLHGCDKEKPLDYKERVEKEVTYRTEKERLHFMRQFQGRYDKYRIDPVKKTILFYNHVGEGKRKKSKNIKK